jgi:hypothetical protein
MAAHHIDFWFTMGSTYSYLSVSRLADVERSTGVTFRWRPFHLLMPVHRRATRLWLSGRPYGQDEATGSSTSVFVLPTRSYTDTCTTG